MPVSSPSYFPPNRSNGTIVGITAGQSTTGARNFLGGKAAGVFTQINDLIVIGDSAFSSGTSGAPITDTNLAGSLAIGNNASLGIVSAVGALTAAPNTVIGFNAASNVGLTNAAGNVLIGDQVLQANTSTPTFPLQQNTVIGSGALANVLGNPAGSQGVVNSTVIGFRAVRGGGAGGAVTNVNGSVIIGSQCAQNVNTTGATLGSLNQDVFIGFQCAQILSTGGNTSGDNVIVGYSACGGASSFSRVNQCVIVGSQAANDGTGVVNATDNVIVGFSAVAHDIQSVVIGSQATSGSGNSGQLGCIILGYKAGVAPALTTKPNVFLVETSVGGSMFYGDLGAGNLIIGNSTAAQRAIVTAASGATNIVQIPNGTKSISSATLSGYFYVSAGALHWVGSAGTDTTLAVA